MISLRHDFLFRLFRTKFVMAKLEHDARDIEPQKHLTRQHQIHKSHAYLSVSTVPLLWFSRLWFCHKLAVEAVSNFRNEAGMIEIGVKFLWQKSNVWLQQFCFSTTIWDISCCLKSLMINYCIQYKLQVIIFLDQDWQFRCILIDVVTTRGKFSI